MTSAQGKHSPDVLIAPATESQIEVWISCLLGGDDANRSYNISFTLELHGNLNIPAFEDSLKELTSRHQAFRSRFSSDGFKVLIAPGADLEFEVQDLSSEAESTQASRLREEEQVHINTVFDLVSGPLFRTSFFKRSDDRHTLIFTIHHIICDGWSAGILLEELSKLYSERVSNDRSDLPEPVSFHTYAIRQQEFLDSEDYGAIRQYWVDQFKDGAPVLELFKDGIRPARRSTKSQRLDFQVDAELSDAVKQLSAKSRSSLVITLRAVFNILLYKISGQSDIVLGLPTAGQPATGDLNLVSHCVNLLPIRSRLSDQVSFLDYLNESRLSALDAYDHQQITFGSLLKELNIPRDNSRLPLISVVFGLDNDPGEDLHFEGLAYSLHFNKRNYENFEIFINATASEKALRLEWSFNEQLFTTDVISRMMDDYESILRTVVSNPSITVGDIQLQDSIELQRNLEEWNRTDVDYPADVPFYKLVDSIADQFPEKTAISFKGVRLTYRELARKSNQMAFFLRAYGAGPGEKIALAVDRSPEMVICLLAILKSGAAYVPVDPSYPNKRIEYMLSDSAARLLITSDDYSKHFAGHHIMQIMLEDAIGRLHEFPDDALEVALNGSDLAYIMYTSGSTGQPKGIAIEHHSLTNFLLSMAKEPGISPEDRLLAVTTISFDISGLELYLPLISGSELVIADADTARDGRALYDLLRSRNVTVIQATPSTWRMMTDSGWTTPLGLKALCGGEALPRDLAAALLTLTSELWNMYGPTETTIWSTVKKIEDADQPISIGRPINNTKIYILDSDLKPVPLGATGEIYIGGEGLARHYLYKPDLTAASFIKSPFIPGQRIYRTGDLGKFLPNGEILCFGRIDNQIKLRGFRIELGAIDHHLSTLEGVKEAVVIAREDRPGDQRLVAYIVSEITENQKPSHDVRVAERLKIDQISRWKQQLRELLPDFMIPSDFVILSALPLLPNRKIDRSALPKPGDASEANVYLNEKREMPRTNIEKLVASVFCEHLGIAEVGLNDDFFELGGHSIIAVKVMNRLEKETGQRLPLATLFQHSTVKGIALMLQADPSSISWDSLVSIKPSGTKMPIYIVHGAGLNVLPFDTLAKNMDPDQPVYGLQAKGLNGVDEPLEKIEDMAAYYIEEILQQNPDGPYALAGFSLGGIIAFDMAKQLKTMGKEVKILAIFDTHVERSHRYEPLYKKVFSRAKFFAGQVLYTLKLLREDPKRTFQYKTESLKRHAVSLYWNFRYGKNTDKQGFYGFSHAVDMKNLEAAARYVLTPYNGVIDLFRAKKRLFYVNDFEYLGWKPYALKGVRIHEIPGEHNYIFDYPNVVEFAEVLQKCLDKANE